MDSWKSRWGVGQWAAYFENQALPVIRRSKLLMTQLESREGEMLAPRDLSDIVMQDPLLCLCLLREAERRKSHRLDHETTTALGAIILNSSASPLQKPDRECPRQKGDAFSVGRRGFCRRCSGQAWASGWLFATEAQLPKHGQGPCECWWSSP